MARGNLLQIKPRYVVGIQAENALAADKKAVFRVVGAQPGRLLTASRHSGLFLPVPVAAQ